MPSFSLKLLSSQKFQSFLNFIEFVFIDFIPNYLLAMFFFVRSFYIIE